MHVLERSQCGQRVFRLCDRTEDLEGISIRKRAPGVQRRAEVMDQSLLNSILSSDLPFSGPGFA